MSDVVSVPPGVFRLRPRLPLLVSAALLVCSGQASAHTAISLFATLTGPTAAIERSVVDIQRASMSLPPFVELTHPYVVGGLLVFAAQLALILGLLVERARRRRAEAESRESEARYRSVVDTQSELICRFLPDTTLTFVNDAFCRFWHETRNELLGRQFVELIPPSARAAVLEEVSRASGETYSHEHPVTLADGSVGWHHWIHHAILDEQGRVIELQGAGRDITDRKRAEEELARVEARNRAILRAIPDLMFMTRCDGTYVDYHARDPTLLFALPERFIGRTIRDVMPPDIADTLMEALGRACQGEDPVIVQYELAMGQRRSFEARLVRAEGDTVLSIVRDITEWKGSLELNRDLAGRLIANQEEERSRLARDLHDGVSQEIAAVAVDLSHLRQQDGSIQSRSVQDILGSAQRRTVSAAESIRLLSHGLHPTVLHHVGLVAAVQAHCAEVQRQHHLQVLLFTDGKVEPASRLVALSLFRIAQEALHNAIRHGRARHATVSLAQDGNELTLAVEDDGRGFDVAAARRNGGLGLASIEERARLVHGRVGIRSTPNQGTTVEVLVPIDDHGRQTPAVDDGAAVRVSGYEPQH